MKPTERKTASIWWVASFLTITIVLGSGIIVGGINLLIGYFLIGPMPQLEQFFYTDTGAFLMIVLNLVILGLVSWNQARFARDRYVISDPTKVALYTTGLFVTISLLFFLYDWNTQYTWLWEDYVGQVISVAIIYLTTRKYLS